MSEIQTVKVVEIIRPKLQIKRIHLGDLGVWLDEFEYVTIHYSYGYTDNASQWRLASAIALGLGFTQEEVDEAING